jgi:hypothetical protein
MVLWLSRSIGLFLSFFLPIYLQLKALPMFVRILVPAITSKLTFGFLEAKFFDSILLISPFHNFI